MIEHLKLVGVIACLMLAQTVFKSAEVIISGEFDCKIFLKGIEKHSLICLGTLLMYIAGYLLPNINIFEVTTIIDVLNIVAIAIVIKTGIACIDNLIKIYNAVFNKEIG